MPNVGEESEAIGPHDTLSHDGGDMGNACLATRKRKHEG
jgi:hypothetical protein